MQTAIDKAKAVTRNLQKYKEDLAETQKKFEETAIMLPKTQEIPDLLRNISDLGREAGLEFLEFAPGIEVQQDFYAEIPINIRLLGPYHNIGNFLDKVSKLDRVVTVNNIKIGQAKEDTNEVLLNATCQLVTYRFTGQKLADGKDKKKWEIFPYLKSNERNKGMDHLNFFRTILLKLMKVSALLFIVFFVSFQTCNAEVANSQGATNLGATQTPSNQSGYEYKNSNRPDPFKPFIAKQTLDPNELVDDSDSELTGMQLFEPGQLNLVGIMDTSSGKIALVQDVTSKGYALREGILIGKHGQIMEISDNQVVIEETYHSRNGKETKKTVLMKLKKDGDDKWKIS